MTPAIVLLSKQKIKFKIHQYQHDPGCPSYGLEAAQKMDVKAEQVFKTLVVNLDNKSLVVSILPVTEKLSMKQVAKVFSAAAAFSPSNALA